MSTHKQKVFTTGDRIFRQNRHEIFDRLALPNNSVFRTDTDVQNSKHPWIEQ